MFCHHNTKDCVCGHEPCSICAECQVDMDRGLWYRREGEAEYVAMKERISTLGSAISMAIECRTLEEALIVLRTVA